MSLETYYEKALEEITKGTSLEYHHGKPLAAAYLDKSNCQKIFDTDKFEIKTLLDFLIPAD